MKDKIEYPPVSTVASPTVVDEFVERFGIDDNLLFPELKSQYRELRNSGDLTRRRQIMFREFFLMSKAFFALSQTESIFVDVILERICRNLNLIRADYYVVHRGEVVLSAQRGLTQKKIGDKYNVDYRELQFGQKMIVIIPPSNDPDVYDILIAIRNKKGRVIRLIGLDPREPIIGDDVKRMEFLAIMLNFMISKKVYDDMYMNIDPLTDYYNRGFLMRANEGFFEDAQVMALIDFDDFKKINTEYGYAGGDAAIRFITEFIEERIRQADFGRWGGEEFVVFFRGNNLSIEVIRERCQKIIDELSSTVVPEIGVAITCSMGLIQYSRKLTVEENIARANAPLQKAKNQGKRLALVE